MMEKTIKYVKDHAGMIGLPVFVILVVLVFAFFVTGWIPELILFAFIAAIVYLMVYGFVGHVIRGESDKSPYDRF